MKKLVSLYGKGKTLRNQEEQEKKKLSKKDKIAYALIVLLGVIAFVVSTILLMEPKEADAATTDDGKQYVSIDEIVDWGQFGQYSDMVDDYKYITVLRTKATGVYNIYLTNEELEEGGTEAEPRLLVSYPLMLYVTEDGAVSYVNDMSGSFTKWDIFNNDYLDENHSMEYIGTNYDFTGTAFSSIPSQNIRWGEPEVAYASDAPYFSYKNVTGTHGNTLDLRFGGALLDFYNKLPSREWVYMGKLNNMDSSALSYRTELEFVVELPTFECLDNLFGLDEGIAYYEYSAEKVVDRFEDAILRWNEHRNLDKQVYRFTYPLIIEPSSDGSFHFTLTYADILNYLRYCNDDARTIFNQYSTGHQGLMAMFARIHSMSGLVVTTYPAQIVTGRTTYNEWGSLLYDSCLEVFVDFDKDSDEFDSSFRDEYDKEYDSYVGGLKDEIKDLQSQLDNYHKTQDAFGNLSGSNVFGAFSGIVSGLTSFASSIGGLSTLIGSVLGFLPAPFVGFIGFTLLSILIISIIKAIRG